MEELCASMPHYNQLLEKLKITKGPLKGEYKCWHCKVNKKHMMDGSERDDGLFACGCSPLKAVMEMALKEKRILGQNGVGNDQQGTEVRRSLSLYDWEKLGWVLHCTSGFKSTWLLDPTEMKAGLQAAADRI